MGHTLHRDQRKTSVPASGSSTKSHKGEVPYCCEADRCRRDKTGILCLHEGIISSPTGRGYQVGNCISDVSLFGLSGDLNYSGIKAGVAGGASGRSLRPAVRVVTGFCGVSKAGSKSRRCYHLCSHDPRKATPARRKQGSHTVQARLWQKRENSLHFPKGRRHLSGQATREEKHS